MAETVGQHSVAAFTSPVNGTTPIDANTVRGNDNTVRSAYVDHDADPGIHVQSSSYASRPVAGTAGRKWITVNSGRYQLWYDDGSRWHEVASDAVNVDCLADANLTKGDVVKITGFNNGQNLPTVNKVSASTDTAFGIVENTVTSGNIVQIVNTGLIEDVDTNGYAVGTILYPNSSGGFTTTKPTSGSYQPAGYVLRGNTNNGVLYVEFSAPRIVERSDNTASTIVLRDASGNFSAGTITAGALTSTGLVTFASLKGTGATTVTNILDEDNMASDSATALATQQSIKAYVDAKVATVDTLAEVLANGNTTGANDIVVNSGQKIRTPLVAAQDGTSAITIANTTGALTLNTALADSNLATISTAGKVANSATTATSANTASAIVARDGSGNFSAGTITAALTGNASTATTLQTARNINGVSFNGSADITVTAAAGTLTGTTLASGVTASSLTSVGTLTSLTVSGDLTVDTNTLSVNAANNRVGIGTTSAVWNSAEKLVVSQSVDAPVITGYSTFGAGTPVLVSWNSATSGTREHIWFADSASGGVRGKIATNGANGLQFLYGSTVGMSLDSSGNFIVDTNTLYVDAANNRVGVGTASPTQTLTVNGNAAVGGQQAFWFRDDDGFSSSSTRRAWAIAANYDTLGALSFKVAAAAAGNPLSGTTAMLLDASGNLGLGVTPSAWGSGHRAVELSNSASLAAFVNAPYTEVTSNTFYNGTNWIYKTSNRALRYQANGVDGQHIWFNAASGTAGNAISFTQAMTLDASGRLQVGGTTEPGKVSIYQTDTKTYSGSSAVDTDLWVVRVNSSLTANQTAALSLAVSDNAGTNAGRAIISVVQTSSATNSGALTFQTNNAGTIAERARITSGGYFKASNSGVYSDAAASYHEFYNDSATVRSLLVRSASATFNGTAVMNINADRNTTNGTYNFLSCTITAVQEKLYIQDSGNVYNINGTYGTISDESLKQDIVDAPSQWDDLKAVRFRKYRMKAEVEANPDAPHLLGVVAQELEQTSPGLVGENTEGIKSVKSSILLMKAAVALQEAMARIEALEARLEALEA